MIEWCSYCQTFLGERAPFEDLAITHGVCARCFARMERDRNYEVSDRTHDIADFFRRTLRSALKGYPPEPGTLVVDARRLGIRDGDLLVGVLQPILYEIGRQFEAGGVPPHIEHKMSKRVQETLLAFEHATAMHHARGPRVALCPAPGNAHDIGMRMFAHLLRDRGVEVECLTTDESERWVHLLGDRPYDAIGLSVALPSQLDAAAEVARWLGRRNPEARLVLGGYVLKEAAPERALADFDLVANPTAPRETVGKLLQLLGQAGRGGNRPTYA